MYNKSEVISLKVFVCVDENFGVGFNNRRQSRDSEIVLKIVEILEGSNLYMNEYSAKLFKKYNKIVVDNDYLSKVKQEDYCFVEVNSLADYDDKIDTVILFKWNKIYPSDKKLEIDFSGRNLEKTFDFKGTSHEKITCEVWTR